MSENNIEVHKKIKIREKIEVKKKGENKINSEDISNNLRLKLSAKYVNSFPFFLTDVHTSYCCRITKVFFSFLS